jgi:para-aminobenzoate synthetase component 1
MRQVLNTPLPYRPDSADLFEAIADQPWAVFLDSGWPRSRAGRWDILAARPHTTLVTRGTDTEIVAGGRSRVSQADPLDLLGECLPMQAMSTPWPFAGGAIGYFAYDLAERLHEIQLQAVPSGVPDMVVGIYDWAVLIDHREQTCHLLGAGRDPATLRDWEALRALFDRPPAATARPGFTAGPLRAETRRADYDRSFAAVADYIRAGDCYQVNLAQPYSAAVTGDRWSAYRRLRALNPAPYSAYLNLPGVRVLSSSPERFLALRDGAVTTRPIKGTRPRHPDPARDRALAEALVGSEKDRAENLMIVDLLRNDLGRVCQPGSIGVPALFEVESFGNVHHLVSTVRGRLAPGRNALDLLRAAFPGGSVTGAPKRRAMQIIAELEPRRRGVYCGAIGYIGHDGAMDTNIAIRTLVDDGEVMRFWAGGGLVADSQVEAEYQECLDKAAPLMRLLDPAAG